MKKQPTPRQKHERKRREAMPIALIQSPLKFIASKDVHLVTRKDGRIEKELGESYQFARHAANIGMGSAVQRMARTFL
jgi:hypothetical protein